MNFDEIHKLLNENAYHPTLTGEYQTAHLHECLWNMSDEVFEEALAAKELAQYGIAKEAYDRFKADALEAAGITGHPRCEDVWEHCLDSGLNMPLKGSPSISSRFACRKTLNNLERFLDLAKDIPTYIPEEK